MRTLSLSAGILLVAGKALMAQASRCEPGSQPYFEFQVPIQAHYIRRDSTPVHPAIDPQALRRAKVDTLVAQFVVDTGGAVVPGTFRMLRGGDFERNRAVQLDARQWHFTPAMFTPECKVPQLVQTPLER